MAKKKLTGFKDPLVAEKLKSMAESRQPMLREDLQIPEIDFSDLRCYVVEISEEVTEADDPLEIGSDVGTGKAYLAQRKRDSLQLEYWIPEAQKVEEEVYNLLPRKFKVGEIVLVVQDRDGDLWIVDFKQSPLVLVEPIQCFYPGDEKQEAYVYELEDCKYVKQNKTIYLYDPLDANMIFPKEKTFAQKRVGCDVEDAQGNKKPTYDIIGSKGTMRIGYAAAEIPCGAIGPIVFYGKEQPPTQNTNDCGYLEYEWTGTAAEGGRGWILIATPPPGTDFDCCKPCTIEDGRSPSNPVIGQIWRSNLCPKGNCEENEDPQPTTGPCGTNETDCQIQACNDIGHNRCIRYLEKVRTHYIGRGSWDILPFPRNNIYHAIAEGNGCGEKNQLIGVSTPVPRVYCMDQLELSAISAAVNIHGLQFEAGDTLTLIEDTANCNGALYIAQVDHKCDEVIVTGACPDPGQTPDPSQDPKAIFEGSCDIQAKIQRVALQRCQPLEVKVQIELTAFEAIEGTDLYNEDCDVLLDLFPVGFCAFKTNKTVAPIKDGGATSFETITALKNLTVDLATTEQESGQGQEADDCVTANLRFTADRVKVPYCGDSQQLVYDVELEKQEVLIDADQDGDGCPEFDVETRLFFKKVCEAATISFNCADCPEESGDSGS